MRTLLFLHGAIGAKDQFESLADKLSGDFEIHTINFSGHGGQPIPDEFSIKQFAGDVLAYIERNDLSNVEVFGYSMGGYVALYLARHYPSKIGRIFTLATKFKWTPEIARRETRMLDPGVIGEKIPAFARQLEQRHAPSDWKMVLEKTSAMMLAMGEENPLGQNDFDQIENIVRIGLGDHDTMVGTEETLELHRRLKHSSLVVFPNTPHPIEKVDAERLVFEIMAFFK